MLLSLPPLPEADSWFIIRLIRSAQSATWCVDVCVCMCVCSSEKVSVTVKYDILHSGIPLDY